jgi:hypothetical protein
LATYTVLGKTGTARRYQDGGYVPGKYTSTFAAIFPADDPQLVVIVKIDNPKGSYYGGHTAAPVTRTMLQQALASRRVAIDRGRLAVRDSAPPEVTKALPRRQPNRPVVRPAVPRSRDERRRARAGRRRALDPRGVGPAPARVPGEPAARRWADRA